MPAPMLTRLLSCPQFHGSTDEESCTTIWYRWLQLVVGTAGFLCFVSYGYYIAPLYDLPITIACFFISGVALISAVLAFIRLLRAYRRKRRNIASTKSAIELQQEQNAGDPAKCDGVPDSTTTPDEVENLRKMLKSALSSHTKQHKTEGHNIRPFPYRQNVHRAAPSDPNQNWVNPQWNVRQVSSTSTSNKLQRTESYESSLRFYQSYKSSERASTFGSSSSERDTYIYSSSSDGGRTSGRGWRKNLVAIPRIEPTTTKPNPQIISHINRDIERFKMERDQYIKRLPNSLPEEFPALPFPKRNREVQRNRQPYPEGKKQFKSLTNKEGSTMTSLTRSRSVINIDECERISRKDILKILASLSPNISVGGPPEPKSSRKRHGRKHSVPKNTNKERA